ncbi:nuclease-related domain-containing protein [Polaromonas naphthalenivorans]|nr:nuclease-related domain-containing protein [Polaromonas naphthalenivorans]
MCINNSEAQAANYLTTAFKRTFDDVRVLTGVVLPLPEGARLATAEYDCIVICNAGVYLFEVKGWNQCLVGREKVEAGHQWYLEQANGDRKHVNDPVAQGSEKFQAMKGYLDARIAIKYYVVLPGTDVQISPTLPATILTAQDISYIPRLCNSATKASKMYQKLDRETVALLADYIKEKSGVLTLNEHIANCNRFQLQKKAARHASGSGLMAISVAPACCD